MDASPLWLTHHHGTRRCAKVAGHLVCRRCLVLYPTVVATSILAVIVRGDSVRSAIPAIWMLLMPMVIEWTLEHSGRIEYSPRRQTVVSVAAGIGGGLALSIHAFDPFNLSATLPIAATATACLASALLSTTAPDPSAASLGVSDSSAPTSPQVGPSSGDLGTDWLARHENNEAERTARLTALLADMDSTSSMLK